MRVQEINFYYLYPKFPFQLTEIDFFNWEKFHISFNIAHLQILFSLDFYGFRRSLHNIAIRAHTRTHTQISLP